MSSDKVIEKLITNEHFSKLADTTKRHYISRAEILLDMFPHRKDILKPELTTSTLKRVYLNVRTLLSFFIVLNYLAQVMFKREDLYSPKISEANKKITDDYKSGEKTEKEDENWIDWDDYLKKLKELEAEYMDTLEERLKMKRTFTPAEYKKHQVALAFFLYGVKPLRNDYRTLKIADYNKNKDNYFDMETGEVVLNKYKTSRSYGKSIFSVPEKLREYIKLLMENRPIESNYLFIKHDGSSLLSSSWSSFILRNSERLLGKRVGSQMLRKSYITYKYRNMPSLATMEAEAEGLGHSLGTELLTYRKK